MSKRQRYADRAVEALLSEVRNRGRGARNDRLFPSVCRVFELANAMPEIDRHNMVIQLRQAAIASGLTSREVGSVISSAERHVGDSAADLPVSLDDETSSTVFHIPQVDLERLSRRPPASPAPERIHPNQIDHAWSLGAPPTDAQIANLSGKYRPAIDASMIRWEDLLRVVPEDARLPQWGASWPRRGLRVLLRLFDGDGQAVAMRGRLRISPKVNTRLGAS